MKGLDGGRINIASCSLGSAQRCLDLSMEYAKGRKQYRYHDRWREVRDADKFSRLLTFGEALDALRARLEQDLAGTSGRSQVMAAVVRMLDDTLIRVGNEE